MLACVLAADPSPHKMTFPGIADQLPSRKKPLRFLNLKWAHSTCSHGQSHQVLAQSQEETMLPDSAAATALCLNPGSDWATAWSSWCWDNIHAAVMYIKKDATTPCSRRQFQLHVLDSTKPCPSKSIKDVPPLHSSASHCFVPQLGWPEGSISPAADAIVMPQGCNAAFIFRLPELARGAELVCPRADRSKAVVSQANWLDNGTIVVQWSSLEPSRFFIITLYEAYKGSCIHSLSVPMEGRSSWAHTILAPGLPYLAVQVQKHEKMTSSSQVYIADLDTAETSMLHIPMMLNEGYSRICWSPSGKYLILAKAYDQAQPSEHPKPGCMWMVAAPTGHIVFHDEQFIDYDLLDLPWGSDGSSSICMLQPLGHWAESLHHAPRLLVLDGHNPARLVRVDQDCMKKPQPGRTSFVPGSLGFVSYWSSSEYTSGFCHWSVDLASCSSFYRARPGEKGLYSRHPVASCIAWHPTLKSRCIYAAANKQCEVLLIDAVLDEIISMTSFQEPFQATILEARYGMSDWMDRVQLIGLQWSEDGSSLAVRCGGRELGILDFVC